MQSKSFLGRLTGGVAHKAAAVLRNPYKKINVNWVDEKFLKHATPGITRSHRLFGRRVYFCDPQEFLYGLKEIFIKEPYRLPLPQNAFILDCGANIGLSVIYLKELCPSAELVAFEPDETNFQLLTKNVGAFGFKGVTLRKEAVWKERTALRFSADSNMGSKITDKVTEHTKDVQAVRLKEFLNRQVDFLKMDIEGAEYEVLMDIADNLFRVRSLFIEYHGTFAQQRELLEMLTLLSDSGFTYYIKEAADLYDHPLDRVRNPARPYDVQLNIFCCRDV